MRKTWTVAELILYLSALPPNLPVKICVPFDGEGPHTWEDPIIKIEDGELRLDF